MSNTDPDRSSTESNAAEPVKKAGTWDWLWSAIAAAVVFKIFGVAGGLVTLGCYYVLRPKLGTWGAVAASSVIGIGVAIGLMAMLRP